MRQEGLLQVGTTLITANDDDFGVTDDGTATGVTVAGAPLTATPRCAAQRAWASM